MANSSVPGFGNRDCEGLVFRVPWEAQIFALVCALQEAEKLPLVEWSAALGEEIRLAKARGDPDLGDTYYLYCLTAFEKWLLRENLVDRDEISACIADWRDAYLNTPHGQPVELR